MTRLVAVSGICARFAHEYQVHSDGVFLSCKNLRQATKSLRQRTTMEGSIVSGVVNAGVFIVFWTTMWMGVLSVYIQNGRDLPRFV